MRPRVAVISTGDEIVPPGGRSQPAQVHDANARLVADAVRELGAEAEALGVVADDADALRVAVADALARCDMVLLSGGTSKGGGDFTYRIVEEQAEIVVHGVALKPGKPLCLAAHEGKPVVVLPGFPTSAIFTFHAFVAPVIRRLLGRGRRAQGCDGPASRGSMTSDRGRTEFTLVNLLPAREGLLAVPLGEGSGSVTTFARADGFFAIPQAMERMDGGRGGRGDADLSPDVATSDLVVVGSPLHGLDVIVGAVAAAGTLREGDERRQPRRARDGAPGRLRRRPDAPLRPGDGALQRPFVAAGTGCSRATDAGRASRTAPSTPTASVRTATPKAWTSPPQPQPTIRAASREPQSGAGTRVLVDRILEGRRPPGCRTVLPHAQRGRGGGGPGARPTTASASSRSRARRGSAGARSPTNATTSSSPRSAGTARARPRFARPWPTLRGAGRLRRRGFDA